MIFKSEESKIAVSVSDGGMYLFARGTGYPELERQDLMRFELLVDNKRITPQVRSDGGELVLNTTLGSVSFGFDGEKLRITGTGRVYVRFYAENLKQFENGAPTEDGGIEVAFIVFTKVLFKPLAGVLRHDAMWIPAKAQAEDFTIELHPGIETRVFECEITENSRM